MSREGEGEEAADVGNICSSWQWWQSSISDEIPLSREGEEATDGAAPVARRNGDGNLVQACQARQGNNKHREDRIEGQEDVPAAARTARR